jgi:hypothetical protein
VQQAPLAGSGRSALRADQYGGDIAPLTQLRQVAFAPGCATLSPEGRGDTRRARRAWPWIPACAGMTWWGDVAKRVTIMHTPRMSSRACPGTQFSAARECGWVPAFAGMTDGGGPRPFTGGPKVYSAGRWRANCPTSIAYPLPSFATSLSPLAPLPPAMGNVGLHSGCHGSPAQKAEAPVDDRRLATFVDSGD